MDKKSFGIGVVIICLIYMLADPFPVVVDDIVAGIIGAVNLFKVIMTKRIET